MPDTTRRDIERAAQLFVQRENFILQAPSSITGDIASDGLEFPRDFIVAAELIADRLERQARSYRAQAEEWRNAC